MAISMNKLMNYNLMPSLEHGALIKISTILWNQDNIRDLVAKVEIVGDRLIVIPKTWLEVEDKVIEKVQALYLTEVVKKKLSNFIRPIGLELLRLRKFCDAIGRGIGDGGFVRESLGKVCWTRQGTIHRKKTAEALIRDENLDIKERYKIACTYCLKDDILMLWNKMSEDSKKCFYSEKDPVRITYNTLVDIWTYDIKGELTRFARTPYKYAFLDAATKGNKVATEYFLQKLTSEEREYNLVRAGPLGGFIELFDSEGLHPFIKEWGGVYCYLLSKMSEVKQLELLENQPESVLESLLDWPWQSLFMEIAKHMWAFLPDDVYSSLLEKIVDKMINGFKDYNYQELFTEFWQQSPITLKKYVIEQELGDRLGLLERLFQIKDIENSKLILEAFTAADRLKFIFSWTGKNICEKLMYDNRLDILEFLVRKCISSKDKMIKFKNIFEKHIRYPALTEKLEKVKGIWSGVSQLLSVLAEKYDKRCVEEENSGPAKRLCCSTSE